MKSRKFSDEQIKAIMEFYPKGDWDTLFKFFPNQKKVNIKSLARRYGIKQDRSNSLSHQDISDKKYNLLTAIRFDHKKGNRVYWKCICDCGNETVVPIYALVKGTIKSCGCLKHRPAVNSKDFTGQKFGMLTVIERLPRYKNDQTYYRCVCDCGTTDVIVSTSNLRGGNTISCGKHRLNRAEFWKLKHPYDDDTRTYTIYRHISPIGKSYVGITKQNVERRFQNGNGYNTQPAFWRAIKKYGWENFIHEILENNLTEKEACEGEQHYINDIFKSIAPNGYNTAEGGATGSKNSKPIIQYYKGEPVNFFETIAEASELLDIAQYTIRAHIGPENEVAGYYFEQFNPTFRYDIPKEYFSLVDESHYRMRDIIKEEARKITISRNLQGSKPVNKYDLEGHYICTFPSIASACESIDGTKSNAVCAAVNPNRQGDLAYGYQWKYDTGNHSDIEPYKYKVKRAVLQIDMNTNEVINEYSSIAEAARALKTGLNQISETCKGKRDSWKGYKWRFKGNKE